MKPRENEDQISQIMNDPEKVRQIILTCPVFLYQNHIEKSAPVVNFSFKDNLNSLGGASISNALI